MTSKPTYEELEQRIQVLEGVIQGDWMHRAVDASGDAILILNVDGLHYYHNPSFGGMFGYTAEQASGLHPRVLFAGEKVRDEVFAAVRAGKSWHGEIEAMARDGRCFPVLLRADSIKDDSGEAVKLIGVFTDITERKQAEEALQQSEEKFKLISEQSLLGVEIIQDHLIKYVNRAYCDISGYSKEEIMNWKPMEYAKVVHPDDREFVMEQVRRKQSGAAGVVPQYQFRGLTKSGETKWLELYSRTILYQGGTADLVVFIDVTDRKHAEEALQESEERFRRFAEAAFEALIIHDEGLLLSANDQYFEMFGFEPEELLGTQGLHLTIAPEAIEETRRQMAMGAVGPYESVGLRKDGTRFPIEVRVREMKYKGRRVRAAAIMDITERKRAEEMLRSTTSA